ncbi:type II CRISPR-associated endonuclease Cas1 [Fontivita pretiosa]|uniref:type II CRISPR-associated endonuclease Cas1 n=1 Tax=Fontivita pretiosa TaxID=2989684 RepID=UPI003D180DCA
MIKRTIDISSGPTYLSVENDQLVLLRQRQEIGRVPCEDVGVLMVDHVATTFTHAVFLRLIERGAVVVFCGANHLPAGMLLPMQNNELTARRMRLQAAAPLPLRKRLWKQIVRQKVRLQAGNLAADHPARRRLLAMADEVKSGDRSNIEGQAARFYWPALMGEHFRRDPDGLPPNNLLNYGYMVMRAAVARALVAAGLHPAFSLQHVHRNNAFALADDMVEVLRPMVDRAVLELMRQQASGFVDRESKQKLLGLLGQPVAVAQQRGPLMVQLHRVATSLLRCYEGQARRLQLPEYPLPASQPEPTPGEADIAG